MRAVFMVIAQSFDEGLSQVLAIIGPGAADPLGVDEVCMILAARGARPGYLAVRPDGSGEPNIAWLYSATFPAAALASTSSWDSSDTRSAYDCLDQFRSASAIGISPVFDSARFCALSSAGELTPWGSQP